MELLIMQGFLYYEILIRQCVAAADIVQNITPRDTSDEPSIIRIPYV
jgi:hypothetical protein